MSWKLETNGGWNCLNINFSLHDWQANLLKLLLLQLTSTQKGFLVDPPSVDKIRFQLGVTGSASKWSMGLAGTGMQSIDRLFCNKLWNWDTVVHCIHSWASAGAVTGVQPQSTRDQHTRSHKSLAWFIFQPSAVRWSRQSTRWQKFLETALLALRNTVHLKCLSYLFLCVCSHCTRFWKDKEKERG